MHHLVSPLLSPTLAPAVAVDSTKFASPLPAQLATPDLSSSTLLFSGTLFRTAFNHIHPQPPSNKHSNNTGTHTNTSRTQTSLSHPYSLNSRLRTFSKPWFTPLLFISELLYLHSKLFVPCVFMLLITVHLWRSPRSGLLKSCLGNPLLKFNKFKKPAPPRSESAALTIAPRNPTRKSACP